MKKPFPVIFLILLAGCGENSSPEGRLNNRLDGIQSQIDGLKKQNAVVIDSLAKVNETLRKLQKQ
jgi:hypothetical protein